MKHIKHGLYYVSDRCRGEEEETDRQTGGQTGKGREGGGERVIFESSM